MNNNTARKRPRPNSDDERPDFIASESFAGSRLGYVFRRGAQGTGYYLDKSNKNKNNSHDDGTSSPTTNNDNENETKVPPRKARGVRIAEERNETRTYEAASTTTPAADELLAQAEQQAANMQRVVLDLGHPTSLRASLKAWHKAVQDNELQRAQYPDDPTQYMESEVALYEHVTAWKAVAADPALYYPILLETSSSSLLTEIVAPLLQHVNTDVSRSMISVLVEWLDPALLVTEGKNNSNNEEEEDQIVVVPVLDVVDTLYQQGCLDLVWANLGRLAAENVDNNNNNNTGNDQVGQGVWDILQLLEHLLDMETTTLATTATAPRATLASDGTSLAAYLMKQTTILGWLCAAIDSDSPDTSPYRTRTLEIVVLLAPLEDVYTACPDWTQIPPYTSVLTEDEDNDNQAKTQPIDALEILLQVVGAFRKKQPTTNDEVDWLENAAMVITSVLTYSTTNRAAFLQAQGVELVARCLKERVHAGGVTLAWLDVPGTQHAVYRETCERMVDASLLKYLLSLWMGRAVPHFATAADSKTQKSWKHRVTQTTIRIVYALTRHLTARSPHDAQARLVAKFASDPAKIRRLVHYLILYDEKARAAEYKFYRSDVEERLDAQAAQLAALDAKLAAGGDIFHRLGAIAAFLSTQSKQCHACLLQELQAKQTGMGLVRAAVEEFVSVLEDGSPQQQQLQGYLEAL